MQLNQKECTLIQDLKGQEQLCIEKYTKYASEASDPQLSDLFTDIAGIERGHFNTLSGIESGKTPSTSSSGSSNGSNSTQKTFTKASGSVDTEGDRFLCSDLLATEKHASHLYDTCIFEFRDESVRQTLNHIQKEEQSHGKMLYDYMKANGMYEGGAQ